jgi:hypothetical protein
VPPLFLFTFWNTAETGFLEGAGVIGDISTPEERGGYFGAFNLGPMVKTLPYAQLVQTFNTNMNS